MAPTCSLGTRKQPNKSQNLSYLSLISQDQEIYKRLGVEFSPKWLSLPHLLLPPAQNIIIIIIIFIITKKLP